ncbi:ABC transporter ATP-binding protein [Plebeiibacterium sediminum]|uniref:ABC transporter ATP-binding protein n=1 Tax=Plebeiibacterium sediminum TaxID=2992112 RepID=A0AAE3M9R3_9BACT|nr:ABC transporter ATP-binding protein [Plebeiobacterium sediminum]MCW3789190.1 ABC transporter ATP-binding protein [Plebeiobacterium sediminum]
MSKTVIKIENLSKIYRLGEVGTGTLSHDLNRWVRMNILGQDDPYAKVGHVNDRTQKAQKGELVAALRDINLEVKEGEVLGIIGKNGAGKSTLLKLLSRVTSPTTGSIKVKGRMASLLEVGTGFHPEMTGRENIYMNGTIMGMRKWEIERKLDEIVEFAGVAKYLDTPTKRYSSGMTVRLGFAIAAHLEPEILVVDEVLAVGDAEFQKKAIGKMQDVSTNDGRTVLFVSHNMASIETLCNKGIMLRNGIVTNEGEIKKVINTYLETAAELKPSLYYTKEKAPGNDFAKLLSVEVVNSQDIITDRYLIDEPIRIKIKYINNKAQNKNTAIIHVLDAADNTLFASNEFNSPQWDNMSGYGERTAECIIPPNFLAEGKYKVLVAIGHFNPNMVHCIKKDAIGFNITDSFSGNTVRKNVGGNWPGLVRPMLKWNISNQLL